VLLDLVLELGGAGIRETGQPHVADVALEHLAADLARLDDVTGDLEHEGVALVAPDRERHLGPLRAADTVERVVDGQPVEPVTVRRDHEVAGLEAGLLGR
jgi:hypothetical protein